MGTGQGPGLRGSAPGGTDSNFIVWGGRGVEGKWARELGPGYLVSEWGDGEGGGIDSGLGEDSIVW